MIHRINTWSQPQLCRLNMVDILVMGREVSLVMGQYCKSVKYMQLYA